MQMINTESRRCIMLSTDALFLHAGFNYVEVIKTDFSNTHDFRRGIYKIDIYMERKENP